MPVACCSPSESVERLVNTDGASCHKLQLDLANEHRVKEVTFALKPDALHRNHLGTEGPHQPASSLCKKCISVHFPLSHGACSQQQRAFKIFTFSFLLEQLFLLAEDGNSLFFNQCRTFQIILLTQDVQYSIKVLGTKICENTLKDVSLPDRSSVNRKTLH